ncbi:MAG: DNA mismatch repair endonuclease MutL [Magnetococcales bacterium]|nr:DNA mismatch repair endonuclease MutL [Magnetococcales bacterium]
MNQAPPTSATKREIRVLPDALANKIAAGEVVERPASVVKELLENSLDAGAGSVEIRIERGGKRLIRISDDGCGMNAEQARLSLTRHATSKIATAEDLFNISTLGFRGEALPAIASIAHMELESRIAEEPDGVRLSLKGGKEISEERVVMPVGTRITIRNLFFNTPARLKFMRADRTETNHVSDLVHHMVLSRPEVAFRLYVDEREVVNVRGGGSDNHLAQRLATVLGGDFADNCLEVNGVQEQVTIRGWIGLPNLHRKNGSGMHLFVNGRWIKDQTVNHAVRESYRQVMPRDRYPVVALFIDLPADQVDVNVHPAKREVRFSQQNFIHSTIRRTLSQALASLGSEFIETPPPVAGETMPGWDPADPGVGAPVEKAPPPAPPFPKNDHDDPLADPGEEIIANLPPAASQPVEWDRSSPRPRDSGLRSGVYGSGYTGKSQYRISESSAPLQHRLDLREPVLPDGGSAGLDGGSDAPTEACQEPPLEQVVEGPLGRALAQIHDTYILAQTREGVVLVDQHAAHERIVMEGLKASFDREGVQGQLLLIPEVLELSPKEASQVEAQLDPLKNLGVVVESFGPNAFAVRELPAPLATSEARGLVLDLVEELEKYGGESALKEKRDEIIARMACHGSVRSGRKLNVEEMNALLRQIESTPRSGQCSHGRPTYVTLSKNDLEKMFGRR